MERQKKGGGVRETLSSKWMQEPWNTLTGRYLAMHEIYLRGRLANFLWKQQTTEARGSGWRYKTEQQGGKLFSVPRKFSSEFVLLAVLTRDRWTGERGGGWRGRKDCGGVVSGLKQLLWRPSLSVEERWWYMIIQHGSSSASSLGWRGPIILCLQAPDPSDKHSQHKIHEHLLPLCLSLTFTLTHTHKQSLSFHTKWHKREVRIEWQILNSVPYSL